MRADGARGAPCRTSAGFQQVAGRGAGKLGAILPAMLRSELMALPHAPFLSK